MNDTQKPYGYKRNKRGTGYTINPKEAVVVRKRVAIYISVGSKEQLPNQGAQPEPK